MSLPNQVLRLCAAWLLCGLALLAVRGVPKPVAAEADQGMCSAPAPAETAAAVWIGQDEARALLGNPAVVFADCRARSEFVGGHIASALSVPSAEPDVAPAALAALQAAQTVIAYCDARSGCESSLRLAARLRELGIGDVRILTGGLPAWLDKSYPAESGNCRLCPEPTVSRP